ncbi:toxin-antitoxin system, toxin component [Streptomyces sp. NPDC020875]|uniref:toxin-antitoxin system, toxin component n=1 Tax=Streptomyces sp. NPDC020875 TaxID=3154898 RepID=UPI0033D137BB
MGTRREMRRLRGELARAVEREWPGPDPDAVFTVLCDRLGALRERPVIHRLVPFPPGTASGLYLDTADRDIICVEERTSLLHQLVIFGHEAWHMMAGHCSTHPDGAGTAARVVGDDTDLTAVVQRLALRTGFVATEEAEAEQFGVGLATRLRPWLERYGCGPRSPLERRIQETLSHTPARPGPFPRPATVRLTGLTRPADPDPAGPDGTGGDGDPPDTAGRPGPAGRD